MRALLIFVKTLAEFGPLATFGRRICFFVLTTEIQSSRTKNEAVRFVCGNSFVAGGAWGVLFPVPVCGSGQELMLLLREQFPDTPIRVEAELMQAMELLLHHRDWLKPGMAAVLAEVLAEAETDQLILELQAEGVHNFFCLQPGDAVTL